jgi:hypothetical protein
LTFIFTYSDLAKSGSEIIPEYKKNNYPSSSSDGVSFDNSSWSDTGMKMFRNRQKRLINNGN